MHIVMEKIRVGVGQLNRTHAWLGRSSV